MLRRIAYGVGVAGTLAAVAMRFIFHADETLTFGVAAVAILGLAYTLGHATEQLGAAAGPRIGGIMKI
jgi:Ca2+/H+ antiporter